MKIVSHPMLVGDPDLRLFLESDSFSVEVSSYPTYSHDRLLISTAGLSDQAEEGRLTAREQGIPREPVQLHLGAQVPRIRRGVYQLLTVSSLC
jgi:hypothetical protein